MITQSQLTILKAAECNETTDPQYKLPNHHMGKELDSGEEEA
jgi:hypothetical protein